MAIKEIGASQIKSDLAQEKIRFHEMENTRRQNKESMQQNEESRHME
jgi:uroporphyrinogen-III synthase